MKRMLHALHEAAGCALRGLLRVLILLVFRPQVVYVSDKAKAGLRQSAVLISNHVRGMDGAAIQAMLPGRRIFSLAAKDLQDKSPALRRFLSYMRTIPVDREHVTLSWLREARKHLRQGDFIYLCPEGRCNRARVVRPFKEGFVTLAASSGVPVIPIYHNGEYRYVFGKRFRMIVGEPIMMTPPPDGLSELEMRRETEETQQVMRELERKLNGFVREEA